MKRTLIMAICVIGLCGCVTNQNLSEVAVNTGPGSITQTQEVEGPTVNVNLNVDLLFREWSAWGNGLVATEQGSTVTLNGNVDEAGYVTASLDTNLRNKTVGLLIQNIPASVFSNDRMIKITVNDDNRIIKPLNVDTLLYNEYVPVEYEWIEFVLPSDFDGKMEFTFYHASLNNLQITAYHN